MVCRSQWGVQLWTFFYLLERNLFDKVPVLANSLKGLATVFASVCWVVVFALLLNSKHDVVNFGSNICRIVAAADKLSHAQSTEKTETDETNASLARKNGNNRYLYAI